jgi:hypothetical protein
MRARGFKHVACRIGMLVISNSYGAIGEGANVAAANPVGVFSRGILLGYFTQSATQGRRNGLDAAVCPMRARGFKHVACRIGMLVIPNSYGAIGERANMAAANPVGVFSRQPGWGIWGYRNLVAVCFNETSKPCK